MRVFDASVLAVALGDDGPDGRRARALLREAAEGAVPDCADVETAAVLRRRWLAGSLDDRRLAAALRALAALPLARFPARPFLPRLYELRANVGAHDAVHVALAESLGATWSPPTAAWRQRPASTARSAWSSRPAPEGRQAGGDSQMSAWKVSQARGSPVSSPTRNQVCRCTEVPWVKLSGFA